MILNLWLINLNIQFVFLLKGYYYVHWLRILVCITILHIGKTFILNSRPVRFFNDVIFIFMYILISL